MADNTNHDEERSTVIPVNESAELEQIGTLPKARGVNVEIVNAPIRAVQPHLAVGKRFDEHRAKSGQGAFDSGCVCVGKQFDRARTCVEP